MKGADHGGPMFFCEDMLEEVIKFIKRTYLMHKGYNLW